MKPQRKKTLSRREALKTLAAVTGVAVLSSIKNEWETPLVQVGVLPAHAQASLSNLTLVNGTGGGPLIITVTGPGSSPISSAAVIEIEFENDGESETLTLEPGTYEIVAEAEMCRVTTPPTPMVINIAAGEVVTITFTCNNNPN